ncbi:MAG: hypothetical protein ACTHNK_10920 [Thermomicrobiales bacterium]
MSEHATQPADQDAAVSALVAQVEASFGARLDDTGRERVRRQCEEIVANGAALAAWALANGNEPATILTPVLGK